MITCTFENKKSTSLRHLTVNAIVIRGNQVLLGKRGIFKGQPLLESGKWGLLGGFLDRDENLIQSVTREVVEESGWKIKNLKLFRINDSPNRPKEDRQNVDIIFVANAVKQIKSADEEVSQLQWFDLNKLPAKEEMAFDHGEELEIYKKYLKEKFLLPILE